MSRRACGRRANDRTPLCAALLCPSQQTAAKRSRCPSFCLSRALARPPLFQKTKCGKSNPLPYLEGVGEAPLRCPCASLSIIHGPSESARKQYLDRFIYLPYRISGSTLAAAGRSQLLARWPGTLSRILSGIQRTARTVFGVHLKRTYSRDTSASSALGVLNDNPLYKSTHSFTHSHVITKRPSCSQSIRSVYALVVNLAHDPCGVTGSTV